ncbi:hypothetical protein K1718_20090 [Roseibium porphyridii]|uniref:Ribbon-helix-helix protein, CopG family n=1 Tax=Roseibium porphyridii TaxID=2866279 RepID=A0ABY8EZ70_9HYPH|nr:hypothetical protein [Roseibium sp. KMA01]WFE88447.1 hypothetical protein K1718_20090 [Roseibium sp. KMA01]
MPKSIPISVRLSDDDVAFLASYEVQGARTPSDKLREILKTARERERGAQDVSSCEDLLRQMARPGEKKLRQLQRETGVRSDLVLKLYERLPEMLAELIAAAPGPGGEENELRRFEADLSAELFSLIEEVFDLGLTSPSRTYDPELMDNRLTPILEIAKILDQRRQSET